MRWRVFMMLGLAACSGKKPKSTEQGLAIQNVVATPARVASGGSVDVSFSVSEQAVGEPVVWVGERLAQRLDDRFVYVVHGDEPEGSNEVRVQITNADGRVFEGTGTVYFDFSAPLPDVSVIPGRVGAGQTIRIVVDANEALSGPPAVNLGETSGVLVGEDPYSFELVPDQDLPEGLTFLSIHVQDAVGNGGVVAAGVLLDFTAPILDLSNPTPMLAHLGDLVSLSVTADEPLFAAPTVMIGASRALYSGRVENQYNFTHLVVPEDTSGINGIVVSAIDLAGNFAGALGEVELVIPAPQILGVFPPDGSAGVTRDSTIRLVFDRAMSPDVLTSANIGLDGASSTVLYDATGFVLTVVPDALLDPDTTYTLTLSTEVASITGVRLDVPFVTRFTTEPLTGRVVAGRAQGITGWSLPRVGEEHQVLTLPLDNDRFVLPVQARADTRVYVFDDQTGDGIWEPGLEPRLPYVECGTGYAMVDTRQVHRTDLRIVQRRLMGHVDAPDDWIDPKVVEVSSSNVTAVPLSGDYTLDVGVGPVRITLFDDLDDDELLDADEPSHATSEMRNLCANDAYNTRPLDLRRRDVSGVVFDMPPGWNVRVGASRADFVEPPEVTTPDVDGHFTLPLYQVSYKVFAFDDANDDGIWQRGDERRVRSAYQDQVVASTLPVEGLPITARTASGTLNVPASWDNPYVGVADWSGSVSEMDAVPVSGGTFSIDVGATWGYALMFDDKDGDHWWTPATEPGITGAAEGFYNATYYDSYNAQLRYKTITGTITGSDVFENPVVSYVSTLAYSAPAGGAFTMQVLPTYSGLLYICDDLDHDGICRFYPSYDIFGNVLYDAEPTLAMGVYIDTSGAASTYTFDLTICNISGSLGSLPDWMAAEPHVAALSGSAQVEGLVDGDSYTVPLLAGSASTIYLYADTNDNDRWDYTEPKLTAGTVNAPASCNLTPPTPVWYTVRGTLFGSLPSWTRPRAMISGTPAATPLVDNTFAVQVERNAPGTVYLFDDVDANDNLSYGEAYLYTSFQTVIGDTSGIQLVSRRMSGRARVPPGWTEPLVGTNPGFALGRPNAAGYYALFTMATSYITPMLVNDDGSDLTRYGLPGQLEAVALPAYYVDTTYSDRQNIDFTYVTLGGEFEAPAVYSNPSVYLTGSWYTPRSRSGTSVAGRYETYVSPGAYNAYVFDDKNDDGFQNYGEAAMAPRSISWVGLDTELDLPAAHLVGPASGVPGWQRPMVVASSLGVMQTAPLSAPWSLAVPPNTYHDVFIADDRDGDGRFGNEPYARIGAVYSPAAGGDLTVSAQVYTLSGSATPPSLWLRPYVSRGSISNAAVPLAEDGSFTMPAVAGMGPVVLFDDYDMNGLYGYESGYQYCPSGVPTQIDPSVGPTANIFIGATCSYP